MISHVFPRVFGMFRDNAIVGAKFTISSGEGTATSDSFPGVSLTNATNGHYVFNLGQAVENMYVLDLRVTNADSDDPSDSRFCEVDQELGGVDAATGKVYFTTCGIEATETQAVPIDNSQIHIVLWVKK